jgi:hypothetical protein
MFIQRIFHNVKQTLVEDNVRSAFIQIGTRYNLDIVHHRLKFNQSTLRESPGFFTLWRSVFESPALKASFETK